MHKVERIEKHLLEKTKLSFLECRCRRSFSDFLLHAHTQAAKRIIKVRNCSRFSSRDIATVVVVVPGSVPGSEWAGVPPLCMCFILFIEQGSQARLLRSEDRVCQAKENKRTNKQSKKTIET